MNPAQGRATAGRLCVRVAESDLGGLQSGEGFATLTAIVVTFEEQQAVAADALHQQLALPCLLRRKIVVAPDCKSFIIHRHFFHHLHSEIKASLEARTLNALFPAATLAEGQSDA